MRRIVWIIALVGSLLVVHIGTAWARGGGWEPVSFPPFDLGACGSRIHVESPVNKEYVKFIPLPGHITEVKVTGSFKVLLTDVRTGVSVEVNASGPGRSLAHPNGRFEFIAQGLNIFLGVPVPGLPDIFITRGFVDVLMFPVEVKKMNPNIIDVCALLGDS